MQFLDGLRERGWYDVALEYLDAADQDPLSTPAFLDRRDLERGRTLAAMAQRAARDSERRNLNRRAVEVLLRFAEQHPDSPDQLDALSQAANLLVAEGEALVTQADRLPSSATSQREELRADARETLEAGAKAVNQLLAASDRRLSETHPSETQGRQQVIERQAEGRFLAADLLFDKARTFDVDSKEFKQGMTAAAGGFAEVHKSYQGSLAGLAYYARLHEGRAQQALGEWEAALECYGDLVDQPVSSPNVRRIVARAYRHRAECQLATNNVDEAIEECSDWLANASGGELQEPEWLAVAYQLAEAYERKASTVLGAQSKKFESEAKQLFREVAAAPGEFQAAARAALALDEALTTKPTEVKTFAEAFSAGRQALERMNATKLAARLAEDNNPESVAELQLQAERNQAEAKKFLEVSLQLADQDAPQEDLLTARHYLCWIYWDEDRPAEAAVMGEFLARRYPENGLAASAAKVALYSWDKMYRVAQLGGDNGQYEARQLAAVAELIARRWPESPEAGMAVGLLLQMALNNDQLDEAEQLLSRLPDASRATAELGLGGSLWSSYLKKQSSDPAVAAALQSRASELLSSGYAGLSDQTPLTVALATGVLYHVQALLAAGESAEAIAVLENPTAGPLQVVASGSLDVRQSFVVETYRAALRAYLAADPPQPQRVEEVAAALENALGLQADGTDQLTRIYVGLGLDLQRQLHELTEAGKQEEARQLALALELLLEKIADRQGAADWKIQNWVAQTQLQLGEGLDGEQAQKYFAIAEAVFRSILDAAANDPGYAPSELAVLGVRKQLGDALRAQGKFDAAFRQYVSVLSEKPSMLDLQQEAAALLQDWGEQEKAADKLELAIRGAEPQADKRNLVWGWLRLASIANQAEQQAKAANPPDAERVARFHHLFFEARFRVAQCRLQSALLATGAERTRQLDEARKNVESMKRLYPELGGPAWQQKFEELLQKIAAEPSA